MEDIESPHQTLSVSKSSSLEVVRCELFLKRPVLEVSSPSNWKLKYRRVALLTTAGLYSQVREKVLSLPVATTTTGG